MREPNEQEVIQLIETALHVGHCLRACGFADDVVRGAIEIAIVSMDTKQAIRQQENERYESVGTIRS